MRVLLDTSAILILTLRADRKPKSLGAIFNDVDNQFFVSSVSAWEIGAKIAVGKLELDESLSTFFGLC